MPYVSPVVENDFKDRLNKCVDIIKNSSIKYQSFGIFGSYARNDYKASSDIDFCIIVPEKPERWMMGALREELEMLHADVVFVTPQYFEHDNSCSVTCILQSGCSFGTANRRKNVEICGRTGLYWN